VGTRNPTSRGFNGFLGLGFLDHSKHGFVPPSLSFSISCFFKTHVVEDTEPRLAGFRKRTFEISTDLAVNFHFSLALE
jgi:hypothetical protein